MQIRGFNWITVQLTVVEILGTSRLQLLFDFSKKILINYKKINN